MSNDKIVSDEVMDKRSNIYTLNLCEPCWFNISTSTLTLKIIISLINEKTPSSYTLLHLQECETILR